MSILRDAVAIGGIALIVVGCFKVSQPLGFVTLGGASLTLAVLWSLSSDFRSSD